MENDQLIKFIVGKKFYNTENLVTKWADESKKELKLVLYIGRFRVAQIVENKQDSALKRYSIIHRVPQVKKNMGSFDLIEQAVEECESMSKFFISQLSSEL